MDFATVPDGGSRLDSVDLRQQLQVQGGAVRSTDGTLARSNVAQPLDGVDLVFRDEDGGFTCGDTSTETAVVAHEAPEREGSVALRLVDLNPSRRKQIRSGATMLFAPWDVVVEEHHVLDLRTERLRIDIRAARGSSEQGSSFDASRVWKLPLTPGMSHEEFRTSVVSWQPSSHCNT